MYEVSGNKAKLVGDYSVDHEIAVLNNGEEVLFKKIYWGDKKIIFIVNGVEYETGPNGDLKAEGNLLVLTDNKKKKKKIDQYGNLIR